MRIMHIIVGLGAGGAEMMLLKLCTRLLQSEYPLLVVSLTDLGVIGSRLRAAGVDVRTLNISRYNFVLKFFELLRMISEWRPTVVQTWMYHADLFGGLAALIARVPVLWNIRQSNLDRRTSKKLTRIIAQMNAFFSYMIPTKIVCCAERAAQLHQSMGYAKHKFCVIFNGFDLEVFRPNPGTRSIDRAEWDVPQGARVVALIARFDPQKDHETFLRAAQIVLRAQPEVYFVLSGKDVNGENLLLKRWIAELGLVKHIRLLSFQADIARLNQAIDIAVSSSSYGEGFPNTIGESMACAVPCVVTDVGDSSFIVGDSGVSVPPRNPKLLADAISFLLTLGEEELRLRGLKARKRIENLFDIRSVANQYEELYRSVQKVT